MLGKRFRRTTSMSHLGPGAAAAGATPPGITHEVPATPHSVPPKVARPLILCADDEFEASGGRVDACYVDVNMATAASVLVDPAFAQMQTPAHLANEGEICREDASMEVAAQGWEDEQSGFVVCFGNASMQKSGVCHSDPASDGGPPMQTMEALAHAGVVPCFQEHPPGLLMPYQMGLWITQNSMHASGKLEQSISPVDFLEVCFYCKRRLRHERDIFIYRGDTAFCSEECRHRQIVIDERRSSRSHKSSKRGEARTSSSSETAVAA